MNKCYRLVYNRCAGVWQAVAENVSGHGKGGYKKLLAASILAGVMPLAQAEGRFEVLPGFDNLSNVIIGGVSDNGLVTVGTVYKNGVSIAYRWVEGIGMEHLGDINNGVYAQAHAVNLDGNVVVGIATDGTTKKRVAFRWVQGQGMKSLGLINNGSYSEALAVNADGTVVVGMANDFENNKTVAFKWVDGKMGSLESLNNGEYAEANAVNAAGNVVVGMALDGWSGNQYLATRWVDGENIEVLGTLDNHLYSKATAVNAAGNVVVGMSGINDGTMSQVAFRWVAGQDMKSLGFLNNGSYSAARAVNAAGNVVVGAAGDGANQNDSRAFRWTEDSKTMQSVEDWLKTNGVTVADTIKTQEATGVSADGNVVVGNTQDGRGFIARVDNNGNGMIDPQTFRAGLHRVAASGQTAQSNAELVLHGMHGNSMSLQVIPTATPIQTLVDGHGQRAIMYCRKRF